MTIFSVLLIPFLLLFSYKVVLSLSDLDTNQQTTVDYLTGKSKSLDVKYGDDEISHLQDVRQVMWYSDIVLYILLLILTLTITFYKKDKEQLKKLLKFGGWTTIIFSGVVLLISTIAFKPLFTLFHLLFFPQGNWIFPLDSLLIQTFPQDFFIWISLKIFLLTLLCGILLLFSGRLNASVTTKK